MSYPDIDPTPPKHDLRADLKAIVMSLSSALLDIHDHPAFDATVSKELSDARDALTRAHARLGAISRPTVKR